MEMVADYAPVMGAAIFGFGIAYLWAGATFVEFIDFRVPHRKQDPWARWSLALKWAYWIPKFMKLSREGKI